MHSTSAILALVAALISGTAANTSEAKNPGYHPVLLGADGKADRRSLDLLTAGLRRDARDPRTEIVVMVHGFRQSPGNATKDYRDIASRLTRAAEASGLKLAPVAVYWPSDPGPMRSWVVRALGQRLTAIVGFPKAVRNPYLQKVSVARKAGRTGLRDVLFRLQDEFPGRPVHLFTHSLGAEMAITALAPETAEAAKAGGVIEQPERVLALGMVTLAGADLDRDLFTRDSAPEVRRALGRARVWWITVPERGKRDRMLEMRRAAGRGDAVGNDGLKLYQEDLDRLLARRGLVLDEGNIPGWHRFPKYYNDRRLKALAASLLTMRQPTSPKGQESPRAAQAVALEDAGQFRHIRIVRRLEVSR